MQLFCCAKELRERGARMSPEKERERTFFHGVSAFSGAKAPSVMAHFSFVCEGFNVLNFFAVKCKLLRSNALCKMPPAIQKGALLEND